jgi:hypothetical protein
MHSKVARSPSQVMLTDEDLLRLLTNVQIESAGTIENARAAYEAAADPSGPFPKLDDLINARWIRTVRGQIVISVDLSRASKSGLPQRDAAAYASLQQHQYDQIYSFGSLPSHDTTLLPTIRAIKEGELNLRDVGSQRPGWVASRLWEVLLSRSSDPRIALQQWLDRWKEIGRPTVVPSDAWDSSTAETFRASALQLLQEEPSIGWSEVHEYFAQQMANAENAELAAARHYLRPVPQTVLERYLWLTSRRCERPLHWGMWPLQDFEGLIRILLADIEATDLSAAPHPLLEKILSIVEQRPEFLFLFTLHVSRSPVLLADLVLRPTSSAWACLLVWQWQLRRDAWENHLLRRDDERTKQAAFNDATAAMCFLLGGKNVPPAEIAGLLRAVYHDDKSAPDTSIEHGNAMRQCLLDELTETRSENIQEIIKTLFSSMDSKGPGTGTFTAALSLVEASHLVTVVNPAPLVNAYSEALARDEYRLSAHQISVPQATVLFELAMLAGADLQRRFLNPLEVSKRLSARLAPDANPVIIADAVAQTVRVHIRVLCRAIAGQAQQPPNALVDALVSTIHTGSLARLERDQVDAFSAHYETDFPKKQLDRPLSADLGDALKALQSNQKEELLNAVLEIEEPLVLAQLLAFIPPEIRGRIEERVLELTPTKASDLYMLNAMQTRIDELLNAEFSDVAATFIEAERQAETRGAVPGRTVYRLRHQLRLHMLRQQWTEIEQFAVPSELPQQEQDAAADTVAFYQALALLKRPDGDATAAEHRFTALQSKHPHVAAYTVNLHAAKVTRLLGTDIFGYVSEEAIPIALSVVAEGEHALLNSPGLMPDDAATIRLNNVLLFLSMKMPTKALSSLDEVETERPRDSIWAYRAVALERTSQPAQAVAILGTAEERLGKTPLLEAARKQIENSVPFAGPVNVAASQDSVPWIRSALYELMRLDAGQQARALSAEKDSLEDFLLTHVREAATAVVGLVPMMRRLDIDSYEDDITALFKELLSARLRHVNWSVHDQSKGGHTAAGNPGERDLSIRKDTGILALIEAVMTRLRTTNQFTLGELTSHFQKLFQYETCPIYFHVTYEMSGDQGGVLEHLKRTSRENAPEGITFVSHAEIPFTDSRPNGFIATYDTAVGRRKTIFLVLDLNQGVQKEAAKMADASNPRKAKKSTPTSSKQKRASAKNRQ